MTVTRAFVDAVEEEVVTLLFGERTARLPAALLPDGIAEGAWIELRVKTIPKPAGAAATRAKRRRLSGDDDGGNLKL